MSGKISPQRKKKLLLQVGFEETGLDGRGASVFQEGGGAARSSWDTLLPGEMGEEDPLTLGIDQRTKFHFFKFPMYMYFLISSYGEGKENFKEQRGAIVFVEIQ